MARIPQTYLLFSSQTVGTDAAVTSEPFRVARSAYSGIQYKLPATAVGTAALYVNAISMNLTVSNEADGTFVTPYDVDNNKIDYLGTITSDNRFVACDLPMCEWAKIVLTTTTDETTTIEALRITCDEAN